ncbi:MAG: AraC family transcriptional regulator [Legionellales bacterium]
MSIDLDTKCIPLAHMQTFFDLRKGIVQDINWLEKRTKIQINNPNEIFEMIIGINPDDFYRNAGIDYKNDVVNTFISPRQCLMLIDQIIRALNMPFLGLVIGNLMTISHHGMAGVAAVTQPTLAQCLHSIGRYVSELFPVLEMYTTVRGNEGMFIISENIEIAPYSHFFLELYMVSFYNCFNHLVGGELKLHSVNFSYPEPAWGHMYRRYFHNCTVRFNQPLTCLLGEASLGLYELPLANRLMALSAEKILFENIPTKSSQLLPLRLRRLLMRYYGAFPSLDTAASDLGMSARTLSRKLAEDGTTYQQILDTLREKLAKEYFSRGGNSVTHIALTLGYTDSSNFAKAFKRWTGLSPSDFMERIPAE